MRKLLCQLCQRDCDCKSVDHAAPDQKKECREHKRLWEMSARRLLDKMFKNKAQHAELKMMPIKPKSVSQLESVKKWL